MMIEPIVQERLHTLGFSVLPREHPNSPGYSGLLVAMHHAPQGHEPESMLLRLYNGDGLSSMSHLRVDTKVSSQIVSPGMVVVRSQQEREVTFFTFGGTLERNEQHGETIFSLHSPAPILELRTDQETIADMLADETGVLFARVAVQERLSSTELLDRLTVAGSKATYMAILNSLLAHGDDTAVAYQHHAEFIAMLQRERDWYEQTKPGTVLFHNLNTLLQTSPMSLS